MISMSEEIPCSKALQLKCPFQYAVLQCEWALHSIRPCTLHSIQNSSTRTSSLRRKFFYSFLKYIHMLLHMLLLDCHGDSLYSSTHRRNITYYFQEHLIMPVHTIYIMSNQSTHTTTLYQLLPIVANITNVISPNRPLSIAPCTRFDIYIQHRTHNTMHHHQAPSI